MVKKMHSISPLKEAEEMQEKYFGEHPDFYKKNNFCPLHAWDSCKKKHSEDVLLRAQVASYRANMLKATEAELELEPDLDEDFEAHMAAIEAGEAQTTQEWNDWYDSLIADGLMTEPDTAKPAIKASKPLAPFKTCRHHLQPFVFKVGNQGYTLYGSAYNDRKSEPQSEQAGVCVFLDKHWMKEYSPVWVNPAMSHSGSALAPTGKPIETPTIFLDWPDMGVLEIEDLKPVVEYLAIVIEMGVEIGCVGGHGRTGTLMALVMVQLGCKPGKAIKTIRKDYCNKAIETKKQEELIKAFAEEVQA